MSKSTIQDEKYSGYCFFCGKPLDRKNEHHCVFGNGLRKLADEDGLKVTTCDYCHTLGNVLNRVHDNPMAEKLSKMFGQAIFERNECAKGATLEDARTKFIKRYRRSYW